MSGRLEGKVALVAGAGTWGEGIGNGQATAIQFAREGAQVLCLDRNRDAAEATVAMIAGEGGEAVSYEADISDSEQCKGAVAACVERFGGLDVLHNNAVRIAPGTVVEADPDRWDLAFEVGVKGYFLMAKHAIPAMVERGGGSIVNVSSIYSIRPANSASYDALKGAVNSLTLHLARNHAKQNIRANALLLGYMDTALARPAWENDRIRELNLRQVPMRRFADPFEGATVAAFLASEDASYVTGVLLPVDGGISVHA